MPRTLTLLLVLLTLTTLAAPPAHAAAKPNVLFIAVDDLRPQLGCYGHPLVKSPNIDALAKRSLQFNHAYCQLALCNPSRASLLSGRRPQTINIFDLKTNLRDTHPDLVTLPQLFKNNGYTTLSFGKIFHTGNGNHDDPASFSEKPWHPGAGNVKIASVPKTDPASEDIHADELPYAAPDCADEDLPDGMTARAAVAALNRIKDQPFFLAVGFHKPHLAFVAPKKYWDLYDPKDIQLPPNPDRPKGAPDFASNDASELRRYSSIPKDGLIPEITTRTLLHGYNACVSYVDAQIGRVLDELDRLNLRDNTIIVLWGDHGYHLGENGTWNKRTVYETATRVPLLISSPAHPTRGQQTDALAEFIDIYPTLADLCALPAPTGLEGKSLTPVFQSPDAVHKSAAFSVYQKPVKELGGRSLARAMVTDRYRLVEWSGPEKSKTAYELYDHQTDPGETRNLAADPDHQPLLKSLSAQLHGGLATR